MWDNRCKIAISGVGYSKVTRSADIPLAAHALEAVRGAVADSGLEMADIDGLVHVDHFAGGTEPVEKLPEIFVDGVS